MFVNLKFVAAAAVMAVGVSGCVENTSTSGATPASANFNREVLISNQTGRTIWRFYGSRVTTSSWEEDILGSNVLPNGSTINIDFNDGTGSCNFDLKAEFQDGSSIVQSNVNVCAVSSVTFR